MTNEHQAADRDVAQAWQRVWQHIDRRRIQLGMGLDQLYEHAGISETTLSKMRRFGNPVARPDNRRKLEHALQWVPGGVDRILDGEEPVDAVDDDSPRVGLDGTLPASIASLPAHVAELTERVERLERALAERPYTPPAH